MGKLNQVVAVVAGKKAEAQEKITASYHQIQKPPLFDGIARVYHPKDEDGDKLPSESKSIQVKVADLIRDVTAVMAEVVDVVATQDYANCTAKGDIRVGGVVLVAGVPVTHLLFLEKQLKDVETFISKLPTLDPAETWEYNEAADYYATRPAETVRTRKIPKAFVKYEATKEHPAQVETFQEDVLAGYWKTTKFSGAIPAKDKNQMLERVRALREAVIKAREEANGIEAPPVNIGKALLKYVFVDY